MAVLVQRQLNRSNSLHEQAAVRVPSIAHGPQLAPQLDLATLLDTAVDGILVADVETKRIVFANSAICKMLGYTADEFRSLTPFDIHPPEALPAVQRYFERLLETKSRTVIDQEVKRKDGSTFYATISSSLHVSEGCSYGVGFFHDITEHKRAADALSFRDKALHAVMVGTSHLVGVESLDDGLPEALRIVGEALDADRVMIIREQGRAEIAALWERDGVPVSLAGLDLSSFPVDSAAINEWRRPLYSGQAVLSHREDVSPEICRLFDVADVRSILLIPIFAAGELQGNICLDSCRQEREWSSSDIEVVTTFASLIGGLIVRNNTRVSRRRSEERFRAVAETARDAIVLIDPSGGVRFWNPAAERLFGYPAEQAAALGPVADWLVPHRFRNEVAGIVAEITATGRHAWADQIVERPVLCRDGKEVPIELSLAPLALTDEQLTVAVMHDISERKSAETALIASESQLSNALKITRAGHWSFDVDRNEFTFNDNLYELLRTTAAEVGGYVMPMDEFARRFCHPDDIALIAQNATAVINSEDPNFNAEFEHRVIFGDGQPGHIAVRIFAEKDEAGRTIRTYGVDQDITERKRNEEVLRRLNRTLRALSSTNEALIHAANEQELFEQMCRIVVGVGGYSSAWVGLYEPPDRVVPVAYAGEGAREHLEGMTISLAAMEHGYGPTATAVLSGKTQIDHFFADDPGSEPWHAAAQRLGCRSCIVLPLRKGGEVFGVLSIYANEPDVFDTAEVELLNQLANDTGFGISALRDHLGRKAADARLQQGLEATVEALANTVERRDAYTAGHQRRVSEISTAIARRLGLSEHVVSGIRLASIIHDVGKIQVPSEILSKPGRLSPLEFALIKEHAQAGYDIVKGIDFPWPVADIILQHHEHLDGSGYPQGLTSEDILIEAKILAVADVMEAMMSHRPYRAALGIDAALAEIVAGKATHFDPAVVDACVALFREGSLAGTANR